MNIPESDWKIFRALQTVALDRFCGRMLAESAALIADESETHHTRYLRLCELVHERDRTLADTFNDLRRSNAFLRILQIHALGLITDDELGRFSPETRDRVLHIRREL